MKRKVLCIALALLMCMIVSMPTFADSEAETLPDRAAITYSFGLDHVSGSTYKMRAKVFNLANEEVTVGLILYDVSYHVIDSCYTVSTNSIINLSKNVTLSSGVYHLRISVKGDTVQQTVQKNYTI